MLRPLLGTNLRDSRETGFGDLFPQKSPKPRGSYDHRINSLGGSSYMKKCSPGARLIARKTLSLLMRGISRFFPPITIQSLQRICRFSKPSHWLSNLSNPTPCPGLSAPKSRDSLRLRRRFLPLPRRIARFLRPQEARFALRRKSLANGDFLCD